MKELRILFTGIGKRIELIEAFRESALELGVSLKIYGADVSDTAPALSFCDHTRRVCKMREPSYISELARICREDRIDLLIPTIDTDLYVLSQNVAAFEKTRVLISKPEMIAVCRDKNKTAAFFEECGCKAPKTCGSADKYEGPFPCFIKPKDGSGSINAYKAESKEKLALLAAQIGDHIVQPFIEGTEYTVDIFCDLYGEPIFITPRIRLFVRAGEVQKTQITVDETIIDECTRIVERFRPVGPMTVQLIRQKGTGEDYFIEINPRFGGGAPLSMMAGANSAKALLSIMLGKKTEETAISDGAIYSRFDKSVCIGADVPQPIEGVIFDLDDTLYNEKDYVRSGFGAVAEHLGAPEAKEALWAYFEAGEPAIDSYLEKLGMPEKKEECLRVYREHVPKISLNPGARELIEKLKSENIKIGIITDGRPTGQRNKLAALGLFELSDDIIITDELGGEQFRKPCDIAFRILQRKWRLPFSHLLYVGDNAAKDLSAPRQLQMQVICFDNPEGLYRASGENEMIRCEKIKSFYEWGINKKDKLYEDTSGDKNQPRCGLGVQSSDKIKGAWRADRHRSSER